jgi:hypothetical protein
MAVEQHPQYQEWSAAFEERNEAERRYWRAMMGDKSVGTVELAKKDYEAVQSRYDDIVSRL